MTTEGNNGAVPSGVAPQYPSEGQAAPTSPPPGYLPPYDAAPLRPPASVEDPAPYHRLFRTSPGYAWWRPLVAGALLLVFGLVASIVIGVIWFILAIVTGDLGLDQLTVADTQAELMALLSDTSNPLTLFFLLGSLAVLLPLVPLAMLCAGLRPVRLRHSVAFRIRWRWMLWCAIPATVITVVSTSLSFLPLLWDPAAFVPVPVDSGRIVWLIVMIIVLVPLQAAAEEYVFRGFIMQAIGAWARPVWVALLVSTVLFTIGHTQYELWGILSVGVMGLGFAVVTWRTGGLEAAIALHTINNVIAFLLLSTGVLGTTQMGSEGSTWVAPLTQLVFTVAFVFWVDRMAKRQGIARARDLGEHGVASVAN